MNIFKARNRRFFLLVCAFALLMSVVLTSAWAIAGGGTDSASSTAPELAFEDLPEFAPKFQQVVARKRPTRDHGGSRVGCAFSGTRMCALPFTM